MIGHWIDISIPLYPGMLRRPEDPPFHIERIREGDDDEKINVSRISMSSHAGTHIDGPLDSGDCMRGSDQLSFSATIGLAKVIEIHDKKSVKVEELKKYRIYPHDRILLKTRNSFSDISVNSLKEDSVYLERAAAAWLAERRVSTVGIDSLFIGGNQKNGKEIHRILIQAGILIIEGLEFSQVKAGEYMLICLPLKIPPKDGVPARAILQTVR